MQKFKSVGLVGLGLILGVMGFWVVSNNKSNETYEDTPVLENKELLSMMLETEAGSGKYQETTASSWPTDGYTFNSDLSKCENGGTLSWDSTNKKVVMEGNSSDKCYVYFDVFNPTLSDYVKSLYTTQGANNLYLHDSTLTNGANDGSYRYAGSSDTTNNFVCFGYDSTDGTCPTDYLYRIIGVFDNQVKLIKYDYAKSSLLGTDGDYDGTFGGDSSSYKGNNLLSEIGMYKWSSSLWKEADINTVNLNTNYINNIGSKWSNKITFNSWKLGYRIANSYNNLNEIYKLEVSESMEEIKMKVSLMYISDYGYAASPSAWTTGLYEYNNSSITSVNWMYMGIFESTSSYYSSQLVTRAADPNTVWYIESSGYLTSSSYYDSFLIRPVFYLNSDISYAGGLGTKTSPFIIN